MTSAASTSYMKRASKGKIDVRGADCSQFFQLGQFCAEGMFSEISHYKPSKIDEPPDVSKFQEDNVQKPVGISIIEFNVDETERNGKNKKSKLLR